MNQVRRETNYFPEDRLKLIAGLVGQNYVSLSADVEVIGEPGVPTFIDNCILISTDSQVVSIWGIDVYLDVFGFEDEYSNFSFAIASKKEIRRARKELDIINYFSVQRIEKISVVSEELSSIANGQPEWVFDTDIALVFHLHQGVIIIRKDVHNDPVLRTTFVESFSIDSLDIVPGRYEENANHVIKRTRYMRDVSEPRQQ